MEVESLLAAARKAEKELAQKKRTDLEAFARELKRRGEEAARQAEGAIREAVRRVEETRRSLAAEAAAAREDVATAIRSATEGALTGTGAPEVEEVELHAVPVAVGQRVRVKTLGVIGELVALPAGGAAEVAVGGKRVRVAAHELVALSGAAPVSSAPRRGLAPPAAPRLRGGGVSISARAMAPAEINLVGLTVDEAHTPRGQAARRGHGHRAGPGTSDPRLRPGQAQEGGGGPPRRPSPGGVLPGRGRERRRRRRDHRRAQGMIPSSLCVSVPLWLP